MRNSFLDKGVSSHTKTSSRLLKTSVPQDMALSTPISIRQKVPLKLTMVLFYITTFWKEALGKTIQSADTDGSARGGENHSCDPSRLSAEEKWAFRWGHLF
jgi:hypothetical protein